MTLVYEPVRTIEDYTPHRNRTLAWAILAWCGRYLNFRFTREQARFLARWYELNDDGSFRYTYGTLRRAKGTGKSPFAAVLLVIEMIGPCRFGGWNPDGSPIAVPTPVEPWVQVFAANSAQTKNVMLALRGMFKPAAINDYAIDPGLERYHAYRPDGTFCLLEAKSAAFRGTEGNRPSFVVCDETWRWVEATHGHELLGAIKGNAAKVAGRILEITNAPILGQNSVAEETLLAWMRQQDGSNRQTGMLYDSLEAPPFIDLSNEEQLRAGLAAAAGDAYWLAIDAIVDQIYSGLVTHDEALRKYLNIVTADADALVNPDAWNTRKSSSRLATGDRIVLALDGGETDDATALVALRVHDSLFQPLKIWEAPDGPAARGWAVDKDEVSDLIAWAFTEYDVAAFFSDVSHWETYVNAWSETYGPQLDIKASGKSHVGYDMRGNQREITLQNMALVGAIESGQIAHTGDFSLTRHVLQTHARHNKYGIGFGKDRRGSRRKVDGYAAALLAYIARTRLVEAGKAERATNPRIGGRAWTS